MLDKIIKKIPNAVTYSRGILGLTLVPILFFTGNIPGALIAFMALASTDLIDGFLARVLDAKSDHGKLADPFADKLLGGMALFTLCFVNIFMALPLIMELSIGIHGIVSYKKNPENTGVVKLGKLKMALLMFSIIFGYLSILNPAFIFVVIPLLATIVPLQVVTFVNYINNSRKKVVQKEENEVIIEKEKSKLVKEEELIKSKSFEKTFSLKEKLKTIRNEIERFIALKEEKENNIGNNFRRKLDKK